MGQFKDTINTRTSINDFYKACKSIELEDPVSACFYGQLGIECGSNPLGKYCWNWNIGNHRVYGDQDYVILKRAWEIGTFLPIGAVKIPPPAGTILKPGEICFLLPEKQQKFAAFETLEDGLNNHLRLITNTFKIALEKAKAGNLSGYVYALKLRNYFTGPVEPYVSAVVSLGNQFLKYCETMKHIEENEVSEEIKQTMFEQFTPIEVPQLKDFLRTLTDEESENA
jgi:hypothetical protein